nr:hypothetical protein [Tanacetum cinerariifolium]
MLLLLNHNGSVVVGMKEVRYDGKVVRVALAGDGGYGGGCGVNSGDECGSHDGGDDVDGGGVDGDVYGGVARIRPEVAEAVSKKL